MSTLHFHQTTTSTPEQFLAALIDFGPGRSKIFGNSADDCLKVHHRGASDADVTEGSGGIWERLHYDWSDRNRVVINWLRTLAYEPGLSWSLARMRPSFFHQLIQEVLQ